VSRLYFGNEFCHYLLPSPAEVQRARQAARGAGLGFTLATPYVPDRGLDQLDELWPLLDDGDEVVVNDWGVLRRLRAAAPGVRPVVGRMMNKLLRDHRIADGDAPALDPAGAAAATAAADRALAQTGLAGRSMRALLSRMGVSRVEFDWGPRGFLWDDGDNDHHGEPMAASVYLPFGYVASGRVCALASLDRPPAEKFTVDPPSCPRPCRRFRLELRDPSARRGASGEAARPLLQVGNTVFFEVPPAGVAAALRLGERMDGLRVVWQPDVPM
jgi:hypothetical protein